MWRESGPPLATSRVAARIQRTRRRAGLERAAVAAIPTASIALVIEALRHAGNGRERVLGLAAAAGTVLAWASFVRSRRRTRAALGASTPEFIAAELRRCEGDRRLAIAVWVTLACELAFLVPWWIGGVRLHARAPFAPIVAWTFWGPATLVVLLSAWSIRLWRNARREQRGFESAVVTFDSEP